MKLAVLGSNGTVGGFLARSLDASYNITAVSRRQVDLCDTSAVAKFFDSHSFDVVINCAVNPDSRLSAPQQVYSDNMMLFANLYANRDKFGRVIHFCSGAEFDASQSITNAVEDELFWNRPPDPYGASKNSTARTSYSSENFYNLRLFGVFYPTELPRRLLPRLLSNQVTMIHDKYFDYLWLEDLLPVVRYYIDTETPKYKDLNVVYQEKQLLSDFVRQFVQIKKLDSKIPIDPVPGLDYTGNGDRFRELDLPRVGIETGMKKY
jgi:nucleoside-diphosphate-sugar epimerase